MYAAARPVGPVVLPGKEETRPVVKEERQPVIKEEKKPVENVVKVETTEKARKAEVKKHEWVGAWFEI